MTTNWPQPVPRNMRPGGVALAPLDFNVFHHDLLMGQFAGGGTSDATEGPTAVLLTIERSVV